MNADVPDGKVSKSWRALLEAFLDGLPFQWGIVAVIVFNGIILGLDVSPGPRAAYGDTLDFLDHLVVAIFVAELALKMLVKRRRFFAQGWNIFDFAVVAIALVPAAGPFSVFRSLRIFRLFRMISVMPKARMTVDALMGSLAGLATSFLMLAIIFYVFVVLATALFGADDPEIFGTLTRSLYSLYELMVFYGAASDVVQSVADHHAWAWLFFGPFILITSFALLNLFIGVISGEILDQHAKESRGTVPADPAADPGAELAAMRVELRHLSEQVGRLTDALSKQGTMMDDLK